MKNQAILFLTEIVCVDIMTRNSNEYMTQMLEQMTTYNILIMIKSEKKVRFSGSVCKQKSCLLVYNERI